MPAERAQRRGSHPRSSPYARPVEVQQTPTGDLSQQERFARDTAELTPPPSILGRLAQVVPKVWGLFTPSAAKEGEARRGTPPRVPLGDGASLPPLTDVVPKQLETTAFLAQGQGRARPETVRATTSQQAVAVDGTASGEPSASTVARGANDPLVNAIQSKEITPTQFDKYVQMLRDQVVVSSGPEDEALKARFRTKVTDLGPSHAASGSRQSPFAPNHAGGLGRALSPAGAELGQRTGTHGMQPPITSVQDVAGGHRNASHQHYRPAPANGILSGTRRGSLERVSEFLQPATPTQRIGGDGAGIRSSLDPRRPRWTPVRTPMLLGARLPLTGAKRPLEDPSDEGQPFVRPAQRQRLSTSQDIFQTSTRSRPPAFSLPSADDRRSANSSQQADAPGSALRVGAVPKAVTSETARKILETLDQLASPPPPPSDMPRSLEFPKPPLDSTHLVTARHPLRRVELSATPKSTSKPVALVVPSTSTNAATRSTVTPRTDRKEDAEERNPKITQEVLSPMKDAVKGTIPVSAAAEAVQAAVQVPLPVVDDEDEAVVDVDPQQPAKKDLSQQKTDDGKPEFVNPFGAQGSIGVTSFKFGSSAAPAGVHPPPATTQSFVSAPSKPTLEVPKSTGATGPTFTFGGDAPVEPVISPPLGIIVDTPPPVFSFGEEAQGESADKTASPPPPSYELGGQRKHPAPEKSSVRSGSETQKPAPASGGWDPAFLAQNKKQSDAVRKGIEEEIQKAKGGTAPTSSGAGKVPPVFSFGAPVPPSAGDQPAGFTGFGESAAGKPAASADGFGTTKPPPASGGWDAAFLAKNKADSDAVRKGIAEEIEKAKSGDSGVAATGSQVPAFGFGQVEKEANKKVEGNVPAMPKPFMFGGSTNVSGEDKSPSPLGFGFGTSSPAATMTSTPKFGFGTATAQKETTPSPASGPAFSFGAASPAASPTPQAALAEAKAGGSGPTPSAGLFGAPTSATKEVPPAPFTFGATAAPGEKDAPAIPAFGTSSTTGGAAAPSPAFGVMTQETTPSTTIVFGAPDAARENREGTNPSSTALFGAAQQQEDVKAPAPFTFGAGSKAASVPAPAPSFAFGSTTAPAASVPSSAPAFTFGASAPAASSGKPESTPFTFGAASSNPVTSVAPTASPSPAFGKPAFGASASPAPFTFGAASAAPATGAAFAFGSSNGAAPGGFGAPAATAAPFGGAFGSSPAIPGSAPQGMMGSNPSGAATEPAGTSIFGQGSPSPFGGSMPTGPATFGTQQPAGPGGGFTFGASAPIGGSFGMSSNGAETATGGFSMGTSDTGEGGSKPGRKPFRRAVRPGRKKH